MPSARDNQFVDAVRPTLGIDKYFIWEMYYSSYCLLLEALLTDLQTTTELLKRANLSDRYSSSADDKEVRA